MPTPKQPKKKTSTPPTDLPLSKGAEPAPAEQQTLLNLLFAPERAGDDSRVLPSYDELPRWVYGPQRYHAAQARAIERTVPGRSHTIRIEPAVIHDRKLQELQQKTPDQDPRAVYPGEREEFVHAALRHLLVQRVARASVQVDAKSHECSVVAFFRMDQLEKVLADHGHTYSSTQIEEALYVLFKSSILLVEPPPPPEPGKRPKRGKITVQTSYLGEYATLEVTDETGEMQKWRRVRLNDLECRDILDERRAYRMSFGRYAALKSPVARHIYLRMLLEMRHAERSPKEVVALDRAVRTAYPRLTVRLSELIQAGVVSVAADGSTRRASRRVDDGIQELLEAGVIAPLDEVLAQNPEAQPYLERWRQANKGAVDAVGAVQTAEVIGQAGPAGGRPKLEDMVWYLRPSDRLANDIISNNSEAAAARRRLGDGAAPDSPRLF